ncbi:endonuclease III [Lacipirellula parvula]|uniref:Endonuclease III n=1 Tax=Lacipirellula parvula TaxID=2650471 RepID=A0A5K7XCZ9_9BACT|nr:endonuclease III [Lacipirellula parvula]BBO32691.1 endonuclease III [Lacipirellula parvula]
MTGRKPAGSPPAAKKPPAAIGSHAEVKRRAGQVVRALNKEYPEVECALVHNSPFELLVATILSAQCTDARVNIVTPALFAKYPDPAAFAAAPLAGIEKAIQSTGFFRNKAKNIKAASTAIVDDHGGEVPETLNELVALAGVGRKTANVVLGVAFGQATGVVVDTHVGRLSRRLGLTANDDPVKVEADLMAIIPQTEWIDFSHRLIAHGRRVCIARKPKCDECTMLKFCPRIGLPAA